MEEGAFYATVLKPKSWFSFGKKREEAQGGITAVDALFRSYSERLAAEVDSVPDGPLARLSRTPRTALSPRQAKQSQVQKYVLGSDGQCALTVLPAASAVASHLIRVLPYVHNDRHYLLCFFGYLSNLAELAERVNSFGEADTQDAGEATTSVVLSLYRQLHGEKEEELFLSELQGRFAFFLYDSQNKQALAARDASGEEELYFCIDPGNGSVAFTNSLDDLPPGEDAARWLEVPPGHYVSGRTPMLHQFALTPEQLSMRERHESHDMGAVSEDESEDSGRNRDSFGVMLAAGMRMSRRSS